MHGSAGLASLGLALFVPAAVGGFTNNIMLTGYWPPTNNMLRPFSTDPVQNPGGWIGQDWEGRGYDIYAFFPEVNLGEKGVGDFEIDYQDTSADWWRITEQIRPVAIITFSWTFGTPTRQYKDWELESRHRNRLVWTDDYEAPFQPTPSPPDSSVPPDHIRGSSLPMLAIRDAVNRAGLGPRAYVDINFGGTFLSEFIGYHGVWYHSLHADPTDPYWNVAAGHIHVGQAVSIAEGFAATQVTLRELIAYVDSIVPEPGAALLLLGAALGLRRR